jgi:hypothetical protein
MVAETLARPEFYVRDIPPRDVQEVVEQIFAGTAPLIENSSEWEREIYKVMMLVGEAAARMTSIANRDKLLRPIAVDLMKMVETLSAIPAQVGAPSSWPRCRK